MKKILRSILVVTLAIMIAGVSVVAGNINIGVSSNSSQVAKGQSVEVTFSLKDLTGNSDISEGINVVEGTVTFDKDVIEAPKKEDFTTLNKWSGFDYNEGTGKFVAYTRNNVTDDSPFLKVALNVIDSSALGESAISVGEVMASEGKADEAVSSQTVRIEVVEASQGDGGSGNENQQGDSGQGSSNQGGTEQGGSSQGGTGQGGSSQGGSSQGGSSQGGSSQGGSNQSNGNTGNTGNNNSSSDNQNSNNIENNSSSTNANQNNGNSANQSSQNSNNQDISNNNNNNNQGTVTNSNQNTANNVNQDISDSSNQTDVNTGDQNISNNDNQNISDNNNQGTATDSNQNASDNGNQNTSNSNNQTAIDSDNQATAKTENQTESDSNNQTAANTENQTDSNNSNQDATGSNIGGSVGGNQSEIGAIENLADENSFPIIPIAVGGGLLVILGGTGAFVFIRKRRSGGGSLFIGLILLILMPVLMAVSVNAATRGDLNGDSVCDIKDAEIMAAHLVGVSKLESKYETPADMNSDRKLTVTDLSLMLKAVKQYEDKTAFNPPVVKNISFTEDEAETNKITVSFDVEDDSNAFVSGAIKVFKDGEDTSVSETPIELTSSTGHFSEEMTLEENVLYKISVSLTYRTSAKDESAVDTVTTELEYSILAESENTRKFQLKDITEVKLYKDGVQQDGISASALAAAPDSFFVEVTMKDMPAVYAGIKEVKNIAGKFSMVLDYEEAVSYVDGVKVEGAVIEVGEISEGADDVVQDTFANFMAKIAANPTESFTLTHDYDAKGYTGNSIIFKGTLNGGGFTIRNLSGALFNDIQNASISNLVIENAVINGRKGILSGNNISRSNITDICIKNTTLTYGNEKAGGLCDSVTNNSVIDGVSMENVKITAQNTVGAICGQLSGNSTIKNCYTSGMVKGTLGSHDLGIRVAGITGWHSSGCTIENVVTNVKIEANTEAGNGGLIGGPKYQNSGTIRNSISFSTGRTNGIAGFIDQSLVTTDNKVYEYAESNALASPESKINKATKDDVKNPDFYKDSVGLSEEKWDFSRVASTGIPELKKAYISGEKPSNQEIYIPNYSTLKTMEGYSADKETLYANLYKLMPFYSIENIMEDAKAISADNNLNKKVIRGILPFSSDDKALFGLTETRKNAISYIKVLYTDNTHDTFNASYIDTKNRIANYELVSQADGSIKIGYNYGKFIVNNKTPLYLKAVSDISAMNFVRDLDSLTPEVENRNVSENFPKAKSRMHEFLTNFFANTPEYQSSDNAVINQFIADSFSKEALKQYFYAFNYFDRLYDIEIGGVNLRDVVFFDTSLFSSIPNVDKISSDLMAAGDNRHPKKNADFYNTYIKPYTGLSLADFIDFFVISFSDNPAYAADPNTWFKEVFKGYIYEAPAKDFADPSKPANEFLEYRVWQHLRRQERFILPFLTYQYDDLYFVTYPTAMMYGNLRLYFKNWDSEYAGWRDKPEAYEKIKNKVRVFTDNAADLYNTMGHVLDDDTIIRISNRTDLVHDSTGNKNLDGVEGIDPVYKNINELIDIWPVHGSAAAFANTAGTVYYCFWNTLDNYAVWTHENIHNQDGYLYFEGKGRRLWDVHADSEQYADGLLTQTTDNAQIVANLYQNHSWEVNVASNQTPDRFIGATKSESQDKYKSWYKNAYEAIRFMDYLEGKAFFELSNEQKAAVVSRVNFIRYTGSAQEGWTPWELTDEEINEKLNAPKPNLINAKKFKVDASFFEGKTIDDFGDLFDNKLIIERNCSHPRPNNEHGSGAVSTAMWYPIFNDNGMVDEGFKKVAFMMAAEGGYSAFSDWCGGKYQTDLAALRGITGDSDITWREYVVGKYDEVGRNAENSYLSGRLNDLIKMYKEAMIRDGQKGNMSTSSEGYVLREIMYSHLKRLTNDFTTSIFVTPTKTEISSAQELIDEVNSNPFGVFELTDNLDFSGALGGTEAIIEKTFFGELYGKGHTITGLTKPLFNKIMYASVDELKIVDANINMSKNQVGALAGYIRHSVITGIDMERIVVSGNDSTGALVGYGERSVFKGISLKGTSSVTGSAERTGGIFGKLEICSAEDVHAADVTISGTSRVGGIMGESNSSFRFAVMSANVGINATGNEIGGLIGRITSSAHWNNIQSISRDMYEYTEIENCYALGKVKGNRYVGGLIGYAKNVELEKCFANVSVESDNQYETGGFVGFAGTQGNDANSGTGKIVNSIAFGQAKSGRKFDGFSGEGFINSGFSNNYEYENTRGASNLGRSGINWSGKVDVATQENIEDSGFYSQTLRWDTTSVWDVSAVASGGLPKLRSARDTNNVTEIVDTTEIRTPEEFMAIKNNLSGDYRLAADIDFSTISEGSETYISEPYIPGDFKGSLDGAGFTLRNMDRRLFGNLKAAEIKNLKIENLNIHYNKIKTDYAIAQNINDSKITNLHVSNSSLIQGSNYAEIGLLSKFTQNSVISSSSFINIEVNGRSIVGGLTGQMKSGTVVRDVYVSGKVTGNGVSGPIAGKFYGESIDRVICNIELSGNVNNGGIVGEKGSSGVIRNSLSLNRGTGKTVVGNDILTGVEGVYQSTARGLTGQEWSGIANITENQLTSTEFFNTTLGFSEDIWNLGDINTATGPVLRGMSTPEVMSLDDTEEESEEAEEEEEDSEEEDDSEDAGESENSGEIEDSGEAENTEGDGGEGETASQNTGSVVEISKASDLLLLNENPEGEFVLTGDIDMSELLVEGETYISTEFAGRLDGGGYTISNMTKPLFSSLKNATIKSLVVDSPVISIEGINVGVLAREASKTVFEEIVITDLSVTGQDYVGGLVGKISYGVDIKNIKLTGSVTITGAGTGAESTLSYGEVTGSYGIGSTLSGEDIEVEVIIGDVLEEEKNSQAA